MEKVSPSILHVLFAGQPLKTQVLTSVKSRHQRRKRTIASATLLEILTLMGD